MANSYVDYMCSSLMSTVFHNKTIKDDDIIFLHLVKKNNEKKILKCTKDNIKLVLSRVLLFKNISMLCTSIEIVYANNLLTSVEIM